VNNVKLVSAWPCCIVFGHEPVISLTWPRKSYQSSLALNQRGGADNLIRVASLWTMRGMLRKMHTAVVVNTCMNAFTYACVMTKLEQPK